MKLLIRIPKGNARDRDRENSYLINDSKDFHCNEGTIEKGMFAEGIATSNRGAQFAVIDPLFMDKFLRIRRLAQIIPLKDLGSILVHAKITKESVIVDAGSGSGALACFLAHHAGKVISYDIRDDHLELAIKNKEYLGLTNVTFEKGDIYAGIQEKNVDVVTLDVPEPWIALQHAKEALKKGGYIVSYNPSVPQAQDFVNKVLEDNNLLHEMTIEILEREWEVQGRRVRPKTQGIGHSGFLTFVRRLI